MNLLTYFNSLLGLWPRSKCFAYESGTSGIVIPVPQKYFHHAYFLCRSLRKLGCELPIQIWQAGNELLPEQISLLNEIPDLEKKDILNFIPHKPVEFFRGFQMKPLSMICSSFQHVIILDADLVFLSNPELLFQSNEYQQYGSLFWPDRLMPTKTSNKIGSSGITHLWYKAKIRNPSDALKNSDFWNGRSMYHQESGAVYINKSRFPTLLKNLYQLNMDYSTTYQFMHGDKETYWIASEMTAQKEPCYFVQEQRAQIGGAKGHLLHSDLNGIPFWFQHGLGISKQSQPIIEPKIAWVLQDHIGFGLLNKAKSIDTNELKFKEEKLSGELLETYSMLKKEWITIMDN